MNLEIELSELGLSGEAAHSELREMPLKTRQQKGGGGPSQEMRSRVLLGGPDCAQLRPRADEDPAIADRREGADFWTVLMTLSIEPADDERLARAWLRVDLSAAAGALPTAFELQPARREEAMPIEQSGSAEATLKAVKVGGALKRSWVRHEAEILARNKHRSDPSWIMTPSAGRPIDGEQDFLLIAKVPDGTTDPRGRVAFGAEVEWREQRLVRDRIHEVAWGGEPVEFSLR